MYFVAAPHIGHEKDSVSSMSQNAKYEDKYRPDSTLRQGVKDHRQNNGDLGASKRKYQSSEVSSWFSIILVPKTSAGFLYR